MARGRRLQSEVWADLCRHSHWSSRRLPAGRPTTTSVRRDFHHTGARQEFEKNGVSGGHPEVGEVVFSYGKRHKVRQLALQVLQENR